MRASLAAALDGVMILVFAAVGLASHEETNPVVGVLGTAWPFLVGAAAGWALVRWRSRRWPLGVGPGIPVVLCAVVVGMLLRAVTGQGIAPAFRADTPVEMADELYAATAGELCERVRRSPAEAKCVLVIAHNPGLEDLALDLVAAGDADLRQRHVRTERFTCETASRRTLFSRYCSSSTDGEGVRGMVRTAANTNVTF